MKPLFNLAVVVCWLGTFQMALASAMPSAPVPAGLEVSTNETLGLTLYARGVQIYECRAVPGDPAKFEWVFKAPEADLFDASGHKVGRHYAGPTWELTDGAKVVGKLKTKLDAPDHAGIPWLLLDAVQGSGNVMDKVRSIQRVETVGGNAPTTGADAAHVGKDSRVEYTATYKFYVDKPAPR